jgi:hypothetical protein
MGGFDLRIQPDVVAFTPIIAGAGKQIRHRKALSRSNPNNVGGNERSAMMRMMRIEINRDQYNVRAVGG